MSAIPSSEQRMAAFRSACKRAVAQADPDGNIPARTSISPTYSDLTEAEAAQARAWLDEQTRAAVIRLDIKNARSWSDCVQRVRRFIQLRDAGRLK